MSGRRLDGCFAGVVLRRFEISSVEKSSFDAGQATVLDPLREFSGEVLSQRVVQAGAFATDLLVDALGVVWI